MADELTLTIGGRRCTGPRVLSRSASNSLLIVNWYGEGGLTMWRLAFHRHKESPTVLVDEEGLTLRSLVSVDLKVVLSDLLATLSPEQLAEITAWRMKA